ncbi:hypothetical protein BASA81_002711 [Batrachochytrium salamandrivorans]|nr:hypothetical protein BASA81_002711 [Batrachochytrium salamandrivorans]
MSLRVFRSSIVTSDGEVDASGVISPACYQAFLAKANKQPSDEEARRFYRILTTHVSGVDGRKPFHPHEERAILQVLRNCGGKWPCFPPDSSVAKGFRGRGFHEKREMEDQRLVKKRRMAREDEATEMEARSSEEFVGELAKVMAKFCESMAVFDINVWKTMLRQIRSTILARNNRTYPTEFMMTRAGVDQTEELYMARARELCHVFSHKKGPQEAVMILDFSGGDEEGRRVVVQNEKCTEFFGNMTVLEAPKQLCICPDEMFKVLCTMATCFDLPGREIAITQKVKNEDSKDATDYRPFFASYWVDPESLLLVITAKAQPQLLPQPQEGATCV